MDTYEELQDAACKDGIDVIDYPFKSKQIKGLYCNGTIAISKSLTTQAEKVLYISRGTWSSLHILR